MRLATDSLAITKTMQNRREWMKEDLKIQPREIFTFSDWLIKNQINIAK